MPREAAQLLHEALELPAEARAALADSLLDSLDKDVDADTEQAWREEIERRAISLDEGTANLVSWEEVQSRLIRQLHR
ncbi:MAG TPA: addiction module protein [Acidobacteriaceae bacterium]|jgi:putative addiction module component (TIGR02574 family)|nr:addiction module protein [Acidobacteriaceae bacterium]